MAGKLFWIISLAIVVTIALLFRGYDVILFSLGLILVGMVALKFSADKGGNMARDIKNELANRVSTLDSMVQDLTKAFKEQADIKEFTLGVLEKTKSEMRLEFNNSLDMMAKKTIDVENGVNQMKRTFSAAFASLDDRLRAIEPRSQAEVPDLSPEIRLAGAEEGYIELAPESSKAE